MIKFSELEKLEADKRKKQEKLDILASKSHIFKDVSNLPQNVFPYCHRHNIRYPMAVRKYSLLYRVHLKSCSAEDIFFELKAWFLKPLINLKFDISFSSVSGHLTVISNMQTLPY